MIRNRKQPATPKKRPAEWLSGGDPMTGAQASYLKTLCEQAATPELFDENLTKAEASKRIDQMRKRLTSHRSVLWKNR